MNHDTDDYWHGFGPRSWGPANWDFGALAPKVDVRESDLVVRVTVELPGVEKDDIHLVFADNTLTVRGEKKPTPEERRGNFYVMERAYGSFRRSISVPVPVDEQKAQATFSEGLLTITLPKVPAKKRKKARSSHK